jgi:hypothetical protein
MRLRSASTLKYALATFAVTVRATACWEKRAA